MKRIAILLLVLVLVVLAGVLVAPGFVDWSKYRQQIETQVEAATGHSLTIGGKISLALLPAPRLYVEDVTLVPAESKEPLLHLARADVNVSVRKLMQGEVIVERVTLIEPRVHIRIDDKGRPNWMSSEIEAIMAGRAENGAGDAADDGFLKSVSLESVRIEDGSFTYEDVAAGSAHRVSEVDLALKADDLLGPYKAKGSLVYDDHALEFDGAVGRLDNLESIPVQLDAALPARELGLAYRGIVALGDSPEIQGDVSLTARKLSVLAPSLPLARSALQQGASIKGMLTASREKVALKTARIAAGETILNGSVDVSGLAKPPYALVVVLGSERALNLDSWFPAPLPKSTSGDKPSKKGAPRAFLPASVALPVPFDATVKISAPEVTWIGKTFRNVQLEGEKDGSAFRLGIDASEGPGNASVDGTAKLVFESRSDVEGGGVVLSDPSLAIDARLISGNVANLLTPFLPAELSQMAALRLFDAVDADINAKVEPSRIVLSDTVVKLDQTTFGLAGSFVPGASGKRDSVTAQAVADILDVDKIVNRLGQNGRPAATAAPSKVDVSGMVKKLSLPFDLTLDAGAQKVLYKNMPIGDVRLKGRLAGSDLALETAAIGDFFGGRFNASGVIGNTQTLQDIDLTVAGQARDLEAVLAALAIDASALPRPFGALAFQADVVGNDQALGFKANVKALKGEVDAAGQLTDVLTAPKINNLTASVNNPNFVEAVRIFNARFKGGPGLEKPLDFYAKIERSDKLYTLSEMKANIGPMPVVGDIAMNTAALRPVIAGNLRFGTVPLGSFVGERSRNTVPAADGGADVRWSRNAINTDWMHAVDLDLKLEAKAVSYDRWSFVAPRGSIKLANGVLTVPDLESGLFGGGVKGSVQVKSTKDPREPVSFASTLDLTQVAVESLAHALTGAGVISSQGAADVKAELKASGISPAAMIVDLSGGGMVHTGEFVLKGVDLPRFARALSDETKPGDTVTGLWKGATRGGQTQFNAVDGTFTVRQGVVNIDPLVLDGPEVVVHSKGNVNLPRWTILLNNEISFKAQGDVPPDVPPFQVTIEGPLDNPGNTFGKGLLEDYLQRKLSRKAQELIGEKVGKELGGEFGEALGKALGGAGGRTAPPQQPPANDNGQESGTQQQQQPDVPPEVQLFQGILNELAR
ncbi:MAG: AsmA family protein [Alphaproteobacteria bacterium]|nr:AsmA family protein [Alphaproteobacteria bacterium]